MIRGPGVVSPSARPSIIWGPVSQAKCSTAALIDIGQDGVGAPDGQEGGLEEEGAHVEEIAAAPQGQERGGADDDKDQGSHYQLAPGETGVRRGRGVVVDQGRAVLLRGRRRGHRRS